MESQVIICNQGDVPGYNTLESYILLLVQVPNKKQSRNFWGFQFVKHTFFGGDFFFSSAVIAYWNITEVNKTSECFWMLSHFSVS